MPNVALHNIAGENIGEIALSENVFGAEVNQYAVHEVVKAYLANQRQGTQSALTRAEVRGGGIKIYRQKGTGRARHSSNRAPIFTHGGVVFAPKPRDYRLSVNKKVKRIAMKSALTSKVNDNEIIVYNALDIENPKTKEMVKVLNAMNVGKALIVLSDTRASRDSILTTVRDLARHQRKGRFEILDLSLDQDTMAWRRVVRNDTATWTQGWAAGGISARGIDRLGVSALPCFVLVDSTGRRLWYGSSAALAKSRTLKYLK